MKIWIDCEFNDFRGDLISMALVDEYGQYFYESIGCDFPTGWVRENVMPVINQSPISMSELQGKIHLWLSGYESIHVIADWPEDIAHFCNALITGPGMRISTPPLTMEVKREIESVSKIPHNALEDARANRIFDLTM